MSKLEKQEVAVITTSGRWPSAEGRFDEVPPQQKVRVTLERAARELRIVSTDGWIATAEGRDVDPDRSFEENRLSLRVVIDFHPRAGGGGCTRR